MHTIKSSREIDFIFRTGRRVVNGRVILLVAPTPTGRDQHGRVAFVAGKKLGGAVVRNRAKRLLRAAAAQAGAPWPGFDVVVIARPKTLDSASSAVAVAIEDAAGRASIGGARVG